MRQFLALLFLVSFSQLCLAQNDLLFGHYMFNNTHLNPSGAAGDKTGFIAFQHRTQWAGYTTSFDGPGGAPSNQMITAMVPVRGFPISSVGINLANESLGAVTNFQIAVPLTYSQVTKVGTFHLGIAPGILSQTQDFDVLRAVDPGDKLLELQGTHTQTRPNFSAGITLVADANWFVGIGAINLLRPEFDYGVSAQNTQEISYSLNAGYNWEISDMITIAPTLWVRTNLSSTTFDLGGIVTLKNKMWTGISYRKSESAIIYLGYSLLEGNRLKAGYSFDYILQNQDGKAPTSHEIFIRYDLPDLVFGGKKKVMTPRFSF